MPLTDPVATTRRELLRAGVATGVAAAGLATVSAPAAPAAQAAPAGPENDASAIRRVLAIEHVIGFAYAHLLASGLLAAPLATMLSLFSAHEQQHASVLEAALRHRGASVPRGPQSVAAADVVLHGLRVTRLADCHNQRDAVQLLIGAEAAVTGAYFVAISKLHSGRLLQTAAQAMAAEAQHSTALRRVLHPRTIEKIVPGPFVQGRH